MVKLVSCVDVFNRCVLPCLPVRCVQASNISDALVRPQAAAASAGLLEGSGEECYDDDGNPQHMQQRVPELPGPPVHPVQVCVACRRFPAQFAAPLTGVASCCKLPVGCRLVFSNRCKRRLTFAAGHLDAYMQAVRCVEVMSLLMQQHLRGLVEEGLRAYLQLWQEYAVQPGSLAAYAGVCIRLQHESDRACLFV
jgi:hypothetical protein